MEILVLWLRQIFCLIGMNTMSNMTSDLFINGCSLFKYCNEIFPLICDGMVYEYIKIFLKVFFIFEINTITSFLPFLSLTSTPSLLPLPFSYLNSWPVFFNFL